MSQFVFIFPGGKKTIQKAAGIAGNVVTTKTVPAGKIWQILNVWIELTTDATSINRYARVVTQDAANISKFGSVAAVQTASLTTDKFWSQGISVQGSDLNALGLQLLKEAEDIALNIINGQAGDSYDYLIEYLEIDAP